MDGGPVEVKVCIIGDSDVGKTSLSMRCDHGVVMVMNTYFYSYKRN